MPRKEGETGLKRCQPEVLLEEKTDNKDRAEVAHHEREGADNGHRAEALGSSRD